MRDNKSTARVAACVMACATLLVVQTASAGDNWNSTLYFSADFGGKSAPAFTHVGLSALPRDWRSSLRMPRDSRQYLPAAATRSPLSLDYAPAQQLSLRLLNSEIAGYRFAVRAPMLNQADVPGAQPEAQQAETGNWFSRNWWEIGLGVVGAGVLAASGGKHNDVTINGNSTSNNNGNGGGGGGNGGVTGVGSDGIGCVNGTCVVPCGTANTPECITNP